ncbi:hypothetical protein P2318_04215 [Myxococcaceae bacterium GXIMD 01537]
MRKTGTWALWVLLLAMPSLALDLRRVGELRVESGGSHEWLDPHRFVRLKNDWERASGVGLRAVTFVVADVVEQKLLRLRFPLDEFKKTHPSLFTGAPNASLLYFDGTLGLLRFDLEAGRIDRRVKAQKHIQAFATTPSGDALISMSGHRGAPRSFEIRRWSDLSLQETFPVSALFPGLPGIDPSPIRATADGRFLVAPTYKGDGFPDSTNSGVVTFTVDETKTSPHPDPVAHVSTHVERLGLSLYSYQLQYVGNTEGYFAPIVASERGDSFVIGTHSGLREDAPFQAGKSYPYALWVDGKGKVVWQRSLRSGKTFLEYEGGSAVATPDEAFIAFFLCYVNPGSGPSARLVKLDRKGKVLWEWTSLSGAQARIPDRLQLLPSGRVLMTGHVGASGTPWVGELDARSGKLLRDDVGSPPVTKGSPAH